MSYQPFNFSWTDKENKEHPIFETLKEAEDYIDNYPCKIDKNEIVKNCQQCMIEWGIDEIK